MMVVMMTTSFDWMEIAAINLEKLPTAIAKAAIDGVKFRNDMKGLIVTANVVYASQQTWRSNIAEAQQK